MLKKNQFVSPYIGIEVKNNIPILYTQKGDYSVIIKCENPVLQYSANIDNYYDFHNLFSNILKILGAGYNIQKQDIFSRKSFDKSSKDDDFLSKKYFELFKGRSYTDIETYLVITGEIVRSSFFSFDVKLFNAFLVNIDKIIDLLKNKGIKASVLSKKEINIYLKRFLSLNFSSNTINLSNIKANDTHLKFGERTVQNISLVDIDEVNFPTTIKPYKDVKIGLTFPIDLFSFLHETPNIETLIYNQVISIPDQRIESVKLEGKKKKHSGVPDPANDLCVQDITAVQEDIAKEGQLLVYAHYNIIVCGKEITKAVNYIESSLFDSGIIVSKQSFNQLELFECALPGNTGKLKKYDKFLTTSDSAICLLFKERLHVTEPSNFLTYLTDRRGLPIGIDMSGKEGDIKLTSNANKFILGPSGSGKSFFMNAVIRQYTLYNTDIVLVDTGHSYSGLCEYYNGKYITYSEEKPITMNPFKITEKEYNEEKREFLKSLIATLWKGTEGSINQVEDTLLTNLISAYYDNYFVSGTIETLSFNSFYEFAIQEIQTIVKREGIVFDLTSFQYILKRFYRGGEYDKILNDDFDSSLFDEKFIVFEIDAIKEHKTLFPIVTLIIIDIFIQKMRLKKNRKALIIEEAWKAIASPMMAGFILYLYKTVRKFWGEAMVVTQELDDIIGNPLVKSSIINNSDIICLLDQTKFKDNYDEIASLLSLGEVERKKIFTINKLNNKDNRNRFNEVYIKRGDFGSVFGVEVSFHEYFTFTTERIEKDTLGLYREIYNKENSLFALDQFVSDMKKSGLGMREWVRKSNTVLNKIKEKQSLNSLSPSNNLCNYILEESKKLNL
ncbi:MULTISPECIES: TraG family conjugative transposon ATPase [Capnocytophaga]|uniref:Conjugation system ATPase, TraG family n=1 Tax=Capnocytophaga canis TaxID=1848903 RepID=A0A0B7ISN4_9FLAO|nr:MULTISPECIES: TraG family conjugative transposon ATPase [Capnocytophaga]GJQ04033.1 hypothetical protein CAPN009_04480 [Capnocytophaga canimorsus]CEN53042.1 Conjugation system ATPase, TraG family [Capnocytophaga canis]